MEIHGIPSLNYRYNSCGTSQRDSLSNKMKGEIEQAVAIFIDGFYYIYAKAVSKDKTLLQELFIEAFDYEMVYVCLYEDCMK